MLFQRYLDALLAERAVGLTSLHDPEAVQRRHFVESLALGMRLQAAGVLNGLAIDIGSGAGLPGLPLAIVWPELRLTLLDANARRSDFLRRVVDIIGLNGVEVVTARAEDLARDPEHRERYDLALARALAPLPVLVELALPLLRVGGCLATPKGSGVRSEIAAAGPALAQLGGEIELVEPLPIESATPPQLVLVRKASGTPERFPRRAGIPAKRPLR